MKNIKLILPLISSIVIPLAFQACTTTDYDLRKDIDLTMHVGGNALSVPVGSTEYIKLNKIIKIDESDILHLNGGEYSIQKTQTITPTSISVPTTSAIVIPAITIESSSISNINSPYSETKKIPEITTPLHISHNNLPSTLLAIKNFKLPSTKLSKVTIKINVTGLTPQAIITLDNYTIKFPKTIVSNQLNSNNEYIISNSTVGSGLNKEFYISGLDFSDETNGMITTENNNITLDKNVTVNGQVTAANVTPATTIGSIILKTAIEIEPITINEIQGKVDPKININVSPLTFDLPDFLSDKETNLDLLDPMIELTTNNPIDIPIIINSIAQGFKNKVLNSEVAIQGTSENPILIDANKKSTISLSNSGTAGSTDSKKYKIDNLSTLLSNVPNEIQFKMNAYADQRAIHTIQLGKQYPLELSYSINAPFKFGNNLCIIYNDTIDNFNKDIKDCDIKNVKITANVENSIPLSLKLDATSLGLNKSNGPLADITLEVIGDIQSCDKDGNAQKSPITIILTEKTAGAMKKLDGIHLRVTAKSPNTNYGMSLKEEQYIRLTDIVAKAYGGVNVDLNK